MIPEDSNRIPVNQELLTRFFSKVRIYPTVTFNGTPCWIWIARVDDLGYGTFQFQGWTQRAHRISFGMFDHIIPNGNHTDHLCRFPSCVNPCHLEDVSPRTNILRGEGNAAKHARKTHCIYGHEFTPENTYVNPRKPLHRNCRACSKIRSKRNNAKLKAINAAKPEPTHCRNGHAYTRPKGPYKHRCLLCMRESYARQRQKKSP